MGGRDLVEPILAVNTHEGIIYLLENELNLTPPDLSPVPEYREKAINSLLKSKLEKEFKK